MKNVELKLLAELTKNPRRSDRELARSMGISQPTVSRTRVRVEKEGLIRYAGIPDLAKLGFEIIALTFANWQQTKFPDARATKAQDFMKGHHNIIFVSTGRGFRSDRVVVSVHKSYSDYAKFIKEIREEWAEFTTITGSFLISIGADNILKPISLDNLADHLIQ
jgi:DNA-binding Lrp family transcriptional regulator